MLNFFDHNYLLLNKFFKKMSEFSSRHIGINNSQKKEILTFLGVENIDELISQTIPENIRLKKSLKLDEAISENDFLNHIDKLSSNQKVFKSYIGRGYGESIIPLLLKEIY